MFKKKELAEFRDILHLLRARLRGDVEYLTDGALDGNGAAGDSKNPTHIAEAFQCLAPIAVMMPVDLQTEPARRSRAFCDDVLQVRATS